MRFCSVWKCGAKKTVRTKTCLTRRQSQRSWLSRLLLSQEPRQPRPWLICDVRQKHEILHRFHCGGGRILHIRRTTPLFWKPIATLGGGDRRADLGPSAFVHLSSADTKN